jgi:hypothetical protein
MNRIVHRLPSSSKIRKYIACMRSLKLMMGFKVKRMKKCGALDQPDICDSDKVRHFPKKSGKINLVCTVNLKCEISRQKAGYTECRGQLCRETNFESRHTSELYRQGTTGRKLLTVPDKNMRHLREKATYRLH